MQNDDPATNQQTAGENFIHHPTEFSFDTIGPADLARTQLHTIDSAYRKLSALSIRSSVEFPGFAFLIVDVRALTDNTQIDLHAQLAFSTLSRVSKVFVDHARCS